MKNLYYKGIENIPVAKDEDIPESERILGGEKPKEPNIRLDFDMFIGIVLKVCNNFYILGLKIK